ncbi:hypothetical protein WS68_24160 [Burkholderia sp. TSV86]|nr:hypothetical protein WS68_24160 [Burkholderia sp. TSV86]
MSHACCSLHGYVYSRHALESRRDGREFMRRRTYRFVPVVRRMHFSFDRKAVGFGGGQFAAHCRCALLSAEKRQTGRM